MTDDKPRKERVLHTRVPEVLEQELKHLAESLRVPVSNVVRTILQDAVDAMDVVSERAEGEIHRVADRLKAQRARLRGGAESVEVFAPPAPAGPPLAGVVGFQSLLLARDTSCDVCGSTLVAGTEAFLGVSDRPDNRRVMVGPECLPFDAAGRGASPPEES